MKEREKERATMFDSAAPASDAAATLLLSSTSQFGSQPCTVKKGTSFNFYIFETSFARRGKKIIDQNVRKVIDPDGPVHVIRLFSSSKIKEKFG
ncbi:hypothetical protein V1477_014263 [Vespula maculifrons]|uniref:Uncharacterized protein n=1 Tax=Vespula maculifrons TaxID=7453 RepID=A0ABD2BKI5_VESMC